MSLTLSELVIHKDHYDPAVVLDYWGWRLESSYSVLLPTALGHIFLERTDQSVWFLDTWSGDLLPVCESYDVFRTSIASDQGFIRHWFLADVVAGLLAAGMQRRPDQCFSAYVSPGLGSSLKPENFSTTTLKAHLATTAAECAATKGGPHA